MRECFFFPLAHYVTFFLALTLVNQGHSASVNTGVNLAQGDWIKLVDDDDYLAPECIEKMTEAITLYTDYGEIVLCSCQARQVDLSGKIISSKKKVTGEIFHILQEDIHYRMLLDLLSFGTPIQVAFQKQAFLKSRGWEASFDGNYDDTHSWVKIAQYGDALFINQYFAYRTLWSGNCHKDLSLQQRLQMNIVIKQRIYSLVSVKYQALIPPFQIVENYLRLHWFFVALKQKEYIAALRIAEKAVFTLQSWILFLKVIYFKQFPPAKNRHSKSTSL